jgi:RNA polymerase sigma-70 factor (ECF subfamily)
MRRPELAESASNHELLPLAGYRDYLRALARARLDPGLRAKVDPSEIANEVILKAHRARDQFRGHTEQQLAAWLRSILNTTLANSLRDCGRKNGFASLSLNDVLDSSSCDRQASLADDRPLPDELAQKNEQLLQLAAALNELPDDQRAVVEMKHLHGLTVAEICERTNRTKPSVVGLLFRGLKALRILMKDSDDELPDQGP